jgi:hypothetical protein
VNTTTNRQRSKANSSKNQSSDFAQLSSDIENDLSLSLLAKIHAQRDLRKRNSANENSIKTTAKMMPKNVVPFSL